MDKRILARALVAATVVIAPTIVGVAPAAAAVGLTPLANFTSPTTVGQVASAQFTVTNNSGGPEAIGPVTVTDLTLIPSCGSTVPGCPTSDVNVFQLNGPFVGTGSPGAIAPRATRRR